MYLILIRKWFFNNKKFIYCLSIYICIYKWHLEENQIKKAGATLMKNKLVTKWHLKYICSHDHINFLFFWFIYFRIYPNSFYSDISIRVVTLRLKINISIYFNFSSNNWLDYWVKVTEKTSSIKNILISCSIFVKKQKKFKGKMIDFKDEARGSSVIISKKKRRLNELLYFFFIVLYLNTYI